MRATEFIECLVAAIRKHGDCHVFIDSDKRIIIASINPITGVEADEIVAKVDAAPKETGAPEATAPAGNVISFPVKK